MIWAFKRRHLFRAFGKVWLPYLFTCWQEKPWKIVVQFHQAPAVPRKQQSQPRLPTSFAESELQSHRWCQHLNRSATKCNWVWKGILWHSANQCNIEGVEMSWDKDTLTKKSVEWDMLQAMKCNEIISNGMAVHLRTQSEYMSKAFQARPMTATRGMAAWVTWSIHSSTAMRGHVARSIGWAPRGVQCLKDCKAKANLGQLLCQLQQMQTCYQNWVFLMSKSVPLKFSKTCSLDPV